MKLLTAVNLMLPKLGEHPVTSLSVRHPTLAIILPEVTNTLDTTLLRGWWFNSFNTTLYPNSEGYITLGVDVLSFTPESVDAAQRGNQLFNPATLDFKWTAPVKGCIVQRVAFDDLPETAAQFIWYASLVNVYATDIGMSQEVQLWQSNSLNAWQQLSAEHLRNKKYSTTKSLRFRRLRAAMRA